MVNFLIDAKSYTDYTHTFMNLMMRKGGVHEKNAKTNYKYLTEMGVFFFCGIFVYDTTELFELFKQQI